MMRKISQGKTTSGELRPVRREAPAAPEWIAPEKKRPGEQLWRNTAVAAALVLCAVALRQGAVPGVSQATDAVMAAVSGEMLLDDGLGKLTFVSKLFPEATLVFGEQTDAKLALPVSGGTIVHGWSQEEPYLGWHSTGEEVISSHSGEVIGVYHGMDEERLVQVMGEDGVAMLYGNLAQVWVETGDAVSAGDALGTLIPGRGLVQEMRVNGLSVDPAGWLP